MLSDLQIEALTHGCAACGSKFKTPDFVYACYHSRDIKSFEKQVELGIIGARVRNFWVHLDCQEPNIKSWKMYPDLHTCIRCKKKLHDKDVVQPVFQIINAKAINPSDPTDVGIELNDRIYFVHADCSNVDLQNNRSNILIGV